MSLPRDCARTVLKCALLQSRSLSAFAATTARSTCSTYCEI